MEYQISVALNGIFMFSTEWNTNKTHVARLAKLLQESLAAHTVHVLMRSRTMKVIPAGEFISRNIVQLPKEPQ